MKGNNTRNQRVQVTNNTTPVTKPSRPAARNQRIGAPKAKAPPSKNIPTTNEEAQSEKGKKGWGTFNPVNLPSSPASPASDSTTASDSFPAFQPVYVRTPLLKYYLD